MTAEQIYALGGDFETAFLLIGGALLAVEILKGVLSGTFTGRAFFDIVASVSTQAPVVLFEVLVMSFAYAGFVLIAENWVTWTLPTTVWTVLIALLACDFVYYWEHRFAHRVRLLWTQHAVHHSSRFMNIGVAVRFGPFEGVASALFHLPLLFVGLPAELIFFGVVTVLAYQTWIHTELIGRLGLLDAVLNTPSNHRVHHGCDDRYIDRNFGGVLIVWDRLFGTYQRELETPRYGLKRDFSSTNPVIVWVSELPQLCRDLTTARTVGEAWMHLFGPPGWTPERPRKRASSAPR